MESHKCLLLLQKCRSSSRSDYVDVTTVEWLHACPQKLCTTIEALPLFAHANLSLICLLYTIFYLLFCAIVCFLSNDSSLLFCITCFFSKSRCVSIPFLSAFFSRNSHHSHFSWSSNSLHCTWLSTLVLSSLILFHASSHSSSCSFTSQALAIYLIYGHSDHVLFHQYWKWAQEWRQLLGDQVSMIGSSLLLTLDCQMENVVHPCKIKRRKKNVFKMFWAHEAIWKPWLFTVGCTWSE